MSEWRQVRIGDFLHRVKQPVKLQDDKDYKLVTVRMHHNGVVQRESKKGKLIGSNMYRVNTGQFILSGIDARHGAFGIVPEKLDGAIVTNDFWYFDIDENVVSRDFFLWLTTTPLFLDACIKSSEGTTNRRRLQGDKFFNFSFHFPEIGEQKRLAKRFNSIDMTFAAMKDEFEQQSEYLKQLRQAVLQEAVEGKLSAAWRKQHPAIKGDPQYDAVALLALIKAEKERLVNEGKIRKEKLLPPIADADKPFDLPDGWVWCFPAELGSFIGGGTPNTAIKEYWNGDIPWITPKDMKVEDLFDSELKITAKGLSDSSAVLLPPNTPVFVVRSGILKRIVPISISRVQCTINQDLKAWLLVMPESVGFIKINVKGNEVRILSEIVKKGMTVESFDFDKFKVFPIPLPPLAEQQAIVARVDSLMAVIDELEKQVAERKEQALQLMQMVLREAFDGNENTPGGIK